MTDSVRELLDLKREGWQVMWKAIFAIVASAVLWQYGTYYVIPKFDPNDPALIIMRIIQVGSAVVFIINLAMFFLTVWGQWFISRLIRRETEAAAFLDEVAKDDDLTDW